LRRGLNVHLIDVSYSFDGKVLNVAVCFTDIPLNFCDEHTATYGKFGIGFKKSFVKNVGGNPARYFVDYTPTSKPPLTTMEDRGQVFLSLNSVFKTTLDLHHLLQNKEFSGLFDASGRQLYSREEVELFKEQMSALLAFDKPMGDLGPARDDSEEIDSFYKEREWKIVPFKSALANDAVRKDGDSYFVRFERKDIRIIIVPDNDLKSKVTELLLTLEDYKGDLPPVINYDELKFF